MKTTIYAEEGVTQIVLTPVTEFEREVLARISRGEVIHVRVAKGNFHRDPEGWQPFAGADPGGKLPEQCLLLRLGVPFTDSPAANAPEKFDENLKRDIFPLRLDSSPRHTFRPQDL